LILPFTGFKSRLIFPPNFSTSFSNFFSSFAVNSEPGFDSFLIRAFNCFTLFALILEALYRLLTKLAPRLKKPPIRGDISKFVRG
jgi:hypothetical protein|tara:strand:+ start:608 stop:862 length:255 start_codon:yes stop_codon:yes gene_type:complete